MLIKKFLKFLIIILLGLVIFIVIWINLSLDKVEISKVALQEKDIFFYLDLGNNAQKAFSFSGSLKFNQKSLIRKNLGHRLAVKGLKLLSPLKLIAIANFKEGEKNPDYIILFKSQKMVRLNQIFAFCSKKIILGESEGIAFGQTRIYRKKIINDPDEINAYATFKDCFILSNNPLLIKEIIGNLSLNKVISQNKTLLNKLQAHRDGGVLSIHNETGKASRIIEEIEKESYYSFFPNIKDVERIYACADFKTDNFINGNLVYFFGNLESMNSGKEDVEFLLKIIKRFFMANRIDFKISSVEEGRLIKFNYQIKKEEKQ